MLNELLDLAKTGGRIARDHFGSLRGKDITTKRPRDYVTHVDKLVEETLVRRIRARFPDHQVLGEEDAAGTASATLLPHRPLWIIDPIDGTTNFMRGIPTFAVSVAFCEGRNTGRHEPRFGVVYDPMRDEAFAAEAGAGVWLNGERAWTSGCFDISSALLATALPFRFPETMDDMARVMVEVQKRCDDQRRGGSAALDLAYTAVGRLDGFYELGIYPWDTAAGELLVRAGGGVATDWNGHSDGIISRRAIVAGASEALHRTLLSAVEPLVGHLVRPELAPVG